MSHAASGPLVDQDEIRRLLQCQDKRGRFAGGEPVTLNFVNADIEAVSRAMGAILKQQFVVDPRVKGTITLFSEQPISPREAYLNYLAALRGLGFTVVEVGGLFKVVPEADAKLQSGTVAVGETGRRGDQILTQIFKLNHENPNNLVAVLRPLKLVITKMKPSQSSPCLPKPGQLIVPRRASSVASTAASSRSSRAAAIRSCARAMRRSTSTRCDSAQSSATSALLEVQTVPPCRPQNALMSAEEFM